MKALLLIVAAAILMTGCKKNDSDPSIKYYGKWELRKVHGGFGGSDSIYPPGNGNIYQIGRNHSYTHFLNGDLDKQGTYSIKVIGGTTDMIYFDNASEGEQIGFTGAQLTIGTTVTDGIASNYDKIGN